MITLLLLLGVVVADPSTTCFQNRQKCEVVNGNLMDMYVETTWQECSLLCQDELNCVAFNHFGPNSDFYPHNACLLFSACESKLSCSDCVIGISQEDCLCSVPYQGLIDSGDYVDIAAEVPSEAACKSLCSRTTHCAVYTYYDSEDLYEPEMCIMLSDSGLLRSATACENCRTGPAACRAEEPCQAAVLTDDGTTNQYVFARSSSTATLVSAEKECFLEVRALAIGGGGHSGGYGGGGGSGYAEYGVIQLQANETLDLVVGEGRETSSVEKDGQVLLMAAAGQDNDGYNGGDGYSGGGATSGSSIPGRDGGSDGSDGEDYDSSKRGGKGSGLDVGALNMTRFVLTPGKAGTHYSGGGYGGGGGGILVNGEKPSGGSSNRGEGFGGGGYYYENGFPGCVLVEV